MHDVKNNVWNVLLWQNVMLNILGEKKTFFYLNFFRHKVDLFVFCVSNDKTKYNDTVAKWTSVKNCRFFLF